LAVRHEFTYERAMADQFLQAWAVDPTRVAAMIGSKDPELLARLARTRAAKELASELQGDELAARLQQIVDGKRDAAPSWDLRRCLACVADVAGTRLAGEVTVPGRGWQDLGPAWRHWGLRAVARLWQREPRWARRKLYAGAWPRILWADPPQVEALLRELQDFDPRVIVEAGFPDGLPRWSEDRDVEDEEPELLHILTHLKRWARSTCRTQRGLAIWLDGQQ
jgi:hypothetical protein